MNTQCSDTVTDVVKNMMRVGVDALTGGVDACDLALRLRGYAMALESRSEDCDEHTRTSPMPEAMVNYRPLEHPNLYPLELTAGHHVCLWDRRGRHKWTIALVDGHGDLTMVGARCFDSRVKPEALLSILMQAYSRWLEAHPDHDR